MKTLLYKHLNTHWQEDNRPTWEFGHQYDNFVTIFSVHKKSVSWGSRATSLNIFETSAVMATLCLRKQSRRSGIPGYLQGLVNMQSLREWLNEVRADA